MNLLKLCGAGGITAGIIVTGTYGVARYFFNQTMIRSNAKREKTQKMAGTDWDAYIPGIRKAKEELQQFFHEDLYITSKDGLKLHGTYFPLEGAKKTVICFHGYTSEGLNDYSTLALFYRNHGFSLLIVDERAHGKSEGTYIGFGCLDRFDALRWIEEIVRLEGKEVEILLHGDSMGGATVLMTAGLSLPKQVKAIVSDCAFTSAWEVFTSVLNNSYHIPAFPILHIANEMVKKRAGYGLRDCNAKEEVAKTQIPILFLHGEADTFVPCRMAYELYECCSSPKKLVIIEGAGHVESCYREAQLFEDSIKEFIFPFFKKENKEFI